MSLSTKVNQEEKKRQKIYGVLSALEVKLYSFWAGIKSVLCYTEQSGYSHMANFHNYF